MVKLRISTWLATAAAAAAVILGAGSAQALDKIVYLVPAPPSLPAFGPHQIAQAKGYFRDEGLDVEFVIGKGGVDVAKQLGAGNAPIGGILGDGPIIVRPNGVPIKTVGLLGGRGFMQVVIREDANIAGPAELKGKPIGVLSFQDTTFYVLQGVLANVGLKRDDVDLRALGPSNIWKLMIAGETVACACVPDWIPIIQDAVKVKIIPSDQYFPSMAQAVGASDDTIRDNPRMVGAVVRATLKGMKDIMDDPAASAKAFISVVPALQGKEDYVTSVFRYYATLVYPGQKTLGEVDAARVEALQEFYLAQGIIREKSPIGDLFTNQFVK